MIMKSEYFIKRIGCLFLMALCLILAGQNVYSQEVDAQKLLEAVDDNLWSHTKHIEGRLIIDNGRKERILTWENWMEGTDRAYTHYKSPAREKGTKMLKVKSKLWMYTPRTDRKLLIAGHLLRQSMMGSDLSYEDMTEDQKLSAAYKATLVAPEGPQKAECCVLLLMAHDKTTTYQSRKLWVDVKKKIVFKQELYAKGGKLLKEIEYFDYRLLEERVFPRKLIFRDLLKENTKTTYIFDEIEFDVDIPKKYFSQSVLKR
jgi:outer membrane lipoprotein-sorting protein